MSETLRTTRQTTLRRRLITAALVWIALALPLGAVALSLSVRQVLNDNFDQRLQSLLLLLIGSVEVGADGKIVIARPLTDPNFQQIYSGWYWFVRADSERLHSRSAWDLPFEAQARPISASAQFRNVRDSLDADLRIAEQTVSLKGASTPVTFAIAADTRVVAAELADFNRLLILASLVLGAGLALAIVAQVTIGLRPLRRVSEEIARVRTGTQLKLSRAGLREIDGLVDQINTLIDQDRRQLERARTNAADLAHSLKTPLAVLRAMLNPQREPDRVEQVDHIRRTLDRQLARAAMAGPREGARTDVVGVVNALVKGMRKIHAARELRVEADMPSSVVFPGDREDIEEMLGNLLDNACKWAASRVTVGLTQQQGAITVRIEDDGPGLSDAQARQATQRGRRFDAEVEGSGLGLAIVEEIAASYGGSLDLERAPHGGMQASLRLPLREARTDT